MAPKKGNVVHRAWNMLRLALLWARKGGIFRRRLAMEMSLVTKHLKRLGHTTRTPTAQIHYFERELSFDETPIFHVKMHRPFSMRFHFHLPCINPQVDFDYDFGDDDNGRKSFLIAPQNDTLEMIPSEEEEEEEEEEEGIDTRAEEFIAKFYQQMKLQRQISLLQYNQTPSRDSTCA